MLKEKDNTKMLKKKFGDLNAFRDFFDHFWSVYLKEAQNQEDDEEDDD